MSPMRTISSSVHAALVSLPLAKSFCMAGASIGGNRKNQRLFHCKDEDPPTIRADSVSCAVQHMVQAGLVTSTCFSDSPKLLRSLNWTCVSSLGPVKNRGDKQSQYTRGSIGPTLRPNSAEDDVPRLFWGTRGAKARASSWQRGWVRSLTRHGLHAAHCTHSARLVCVKSLLPWTIPRA